MASGPSLSDEVAFISGIDAAGRIARTAFATWDAPAPIDDKSDAPLPTTITYKNVSEAVKWGSATPGTGATITYAFAAGWTPNEQKVWQAALEVWTAVANVTFTHVGDATAASFFIVRGNPTLGDQKGDGAFQQFSSQHPANVNFESKTLTTPGSNGTKIVIATGDGSFGPITLDPTTKGGYPLLTQVHEIGHLLGLGHSGPYNGDLNQSIQQYSQYDTRLYAAMSYISPDETNAKYYDSYPVIGTNWGTTTEGDFTYKNVPVTPQMLDILAVQALYGVPTTGPLASGGQIFGFNSNVGSGLDLFYDFNINKNAVVTIWDGGVGNTLDLSRFDKAAIVSLVPGTFSSADGKVNNIAIAFDTVVETLRAGSGNDTIVGNAFNNVIQGNAGNDTIDGAAGINTSVYTAPSKGYAITMTVGSESQSVRTKVGTDGTDTVMNIQKLQFTDQTLDATWITKTAALSAAQITNLTDLYVASFNRAPDALGFDYWGGQLKDGMSLASIAASFFVQAEAKAAYPDGQSAPVFVTEVYSNLLGRAPDPDGLTYWVGQLQSGRLDKGTFLLSTIGGVLGADATYVANKGAVGAHFALTQGLSNVAAAQTVMALVNGTASSVPAANAQTDSFAATAETTAGTELVVKILGIVA